jgi:hypothetical protein
MNGRSWILALAAGLCSSLPACQTPLVLRNAQFASTTPSESPAKADDKESSSPYAAVDRTEKQRNSLGGNNVVRNDSVSRSPYSALPPPTTPEMPTKAKDASLEAKRAQVLAAVMKPTQAPLPDPPPPDPPTWDIDSPAPTPYAASRNQPPLPPPQFAVGTVNDSNAPTPYAAPADPHTASTLKQSPFPVSGLGSPYAGSASQQTTRPAPKPTGTKADSLSPYAEVPAQSPTTRLVQPGPAAPLIEKTAIQSAEIKKEAEPSSPKIDETRNQTDSHIQQMSSARELNFREIHEVPATSGPDVDLDWTNDSSSVLDPSMKRKSDDPPLVTAMRCFMCKRPAEALNWLKRYDEPNQELIMRFFPLIVRIPERDLTRADVDKATSILEDLYNLFGYPGEGDLAISKLCLCKHIKTFGDYEPFPEDHQFQPRDLVWIYAEIRNFTCERRDMGNGELFYETKLKTTARITNCDGTREWPLQFDRRYELDRSRSLRRDYWDNLSFNVPDNLPPGGYTLWLKVEDEPTHRFKERTVDFQVVPSSRGS